jgi:hypothetical protein
MFKPVQQTDQLDPDTSIHVHERPDNVLLGVPGGVPDEREEGPQTQSGSVKALLWQSIFYFEF